MYGDFAPGEHVPNIFASINDVLDGRGGDDSLWSGIGTDTGNDLIFGDERHDFILSKVIPEPFKTEEAGSTASTHSLLRAEKEKTCSRTILSSTYTLGEPDSDEGAKSTSPAPFEGTADEFDPYATVCS